MKQNKPKQGQQSRSSSISEGSKHGPNTPTKKSASQFNGNFKESAADCRRGSNRAVLEIAIAVPQNQGWGLRSVP